MLWVMIFEIINNLKQPTRPFSVFKNKCYLKILIGDVKNKEFECDQRIKLN